MGQQLVNFLIWNAYGCGHLIPYCVMTATVRGNGCLQKNEDNDRWSSRRYKPDDELPHDVLKFRNEHLMIDLVELVYWGSFGVRYKSIETTKEEGNGWKEEIIQNTPEDMEIDIE